MQPVENTGFLGALRRTEGVILHIMKWAIIVGMASMVFVVFLQIISRYVFAMSLSWSEEVARLTFICVAFMGAAILAGREQHLTVTVLVDLFNPRLRYSLAAFASFVGLVCGWYWVQGGWTTMLREWDQRTPALQFPMGIIYLIIFASVCLLTAWQFVVMLKNAQRAFKGETE